MKLSGRSIIGDSRGSQTDEVFYAFNPAASEQIEPAFHAATVAEIDKVADLATLAAVEYKHKSSKQRSAFLHAIADEIESLASPIKQRVILETALPAGRIDGEFARTVNQMRLFAEVAKEGSWVQARIDHADPERQPVPKPDVRSMLRPVGPVLVFGASNFPLAISTAGGDTAAALAAGNSVIVKAHPAHPGTSELLGLAIQQAAQKCGMPPGVFSLLFGADHQLGAALVTNPAIKAVGFTGSYAGGRALMDLAAARSEPIPFFAEMGSVNPIVVLAEAANERGTAIATGLYAAVTLGVGQFCTNPGLVILEGSVEQQGDANGVESIISELVKLMKESSAEPMLTAGICSAYHQGIKRLAAISGVKMLVEPSADSTGYCVGPGLLETTAETLLAERSLMHEVFGPCTLLVRTSSHAEVLELVEALEGQLTATIHGTPNDLSENHELIDALEQKAGRIIVNSFPTGVEVCHAMIHGGPYPATSDGRSTSIGTQSIFRFARPICYQGFPKTLLPAELRDENPTGIWRLVDGEFRR